MSTLYVCPLSALEDSLQASKARWMISLMAPSKSLKTPDQIQAGHLALEFHDIVEARENLLPPNEKQIGNLLNFASQWNGQGALLIHCWMGISRSTAAALLIAAQAKPEQDMEKLAQSLRDKSPMATPNSLMIGIGDDLLGLEGRLVRGVQKIGRGAEAFEGKPFSLKLDT